MTDFFYEEIFHYEKLYQITSLKNNSYVKIKR